MLKFNLASGETAFGLVVWENFAISKHGEGTLWKCAPGSVEILHGCCFLWVCPSINFRLTWGVNESNCLSSTRKTISKCFTDCVKGSQGPQNIKVIYNITTSEPPMSSSLLVLYRWGYQSWGLWGICWDAAWPQGWETVNCSHWCLPFFVCDRQMWMWKWFPRPCFGLQG